MSKNKEWRPSATLDSLKQRAAIVSIIRAFFAERQVMEVETPLLCRTTVTAPFLHSLSLSYAQENWYLQTSPEYAMKRLLATGSGAIYQICKAFRADESGRLHHPEFTMLEWYRPGFDHHDLMNDMDDLLQQVLHCQPAQRLSYATLFQHYLAINPHTVSLEDLQQLAVKNHLNILPDQLDHDDWLQLLLSHLIEPQLGKESPVFIYDYPATQAALARIRRDEIPVAERFEVYMDGLELANGFHELANSTEQRQRFEQDLKKRAELGYPKIPIDENLLAALDSLPNCSGVALGLDRLVMIALQKSHLNEVVAFANLY